MNYIKKYEIIVNTKNRHYTMETEAFTESKAIKNVLEELREQEETEIVSYFVRRIA